MGFVRQPSTQHRVAVPGILKDGPQDRRWLRPVALGDPRQILVRQLPAGLQHLIDDAKRVRLQQEVPGELYQHRVPPSTRFLQLHEHRAAGVTDTARQVEDDSIGRVAARVRLGLGPYLEYRPGILEDPSGDLANRHQHGLRASPRTTRTSFMNGANSPRWSYQTTIFRALSLSPRSFAM